MAKIQSVKGTRDFYPPLMAVHNYLLDGWKRISLRNGFEEYEGPIFEYLKMYQVKSGDEIVEQLFHFTDRGERELAIRPEITPTLARMVNQQINALPRPIKWFSMPRLCRAERPQKGRLREFWQWNIDIIGADDPLADAEVIFTTLDYLREVGLTAKDIKAKISSRRLLAALFGSMGVPAEKYEPLYALLDKRAKLPPEVFEQQVREMAGDEITEKRILALMECDSVDGIASIVELSPEAQAALDELGRVFELLTFMGVGEYCIFDMGIVRGLAYYTGMVFEVHDAVGELRAVCGGGRYDNLLRDFGGPSVGATGMGMGDCVLGILLEEKGLLAAKVPPSKQVEYFVACVDEKYMPKALELVAKLRRDNRKTEFSYKSGGLGKQLKQASGLGAAKAVIVGEEIERGQVAVKDLTAGTQEVIDLSNM